MRLLTQQSERSRLLNARGHIMNGESEDVVSYEPGALCWLQHEGLGEAVRRILVCLETSL